MGQTVAASGERGEAALALMRRWVEAVPVAERPREVLAEAALAREDWASAIEHLAFLDARTVTSASYAVRLARAYEALGDAESAMRSAERAVRLDPFNPALREQAARAALIAGEAGAAERHLEALVRIEPDRAVHQRRLEAFRARAGAG